MPHPKAYDPQDGYMYQILCRNLEYGRAWEHCDYAKDLPERRYLVGEYRLAYGAGWEFKHITLPKKFWPKQDSHELLARATLCTNIRGMQGVLGEKVMTVCKLYNYRTEDLRKMQDELLPRYNKIIRKRRRDHEKENVHRNNV